VAATVFAVGLPAASNVQPSQPSAKCDRHSSPPDAVVDACNVAIQDAALTPPARADLLLVRGQAQEALGRHEQAVADFSQVIEIVSKLADAMTTASKDAIESGPGASVPVSYVARLRYDLATAYGERGTALRREGKIDAAMADFDAALKIGPDYPSALQQRAVAWKQKGRIDLALADLSAAIRVRPNWAPPYVARGAIYSDQGDDERALADLNEAIRLAPKFPDAYVNRSAVLVDKHDYAGALTDVNIVIGMRQNEPSALFNRAIIWNREGEPEKALADYTTVIELFASGHVEPGGDPWLDTSRDYAEALAARAGVHVELGDFAAANAAADRAVQLGPTLYQTWNTRCWARGAANVELAAASTDCDRALQLAQTKHDSAEGLDSRALVRYRQGRFDLAVADEDAAIAADAKEPSFRFMRGLAEERLGKAEAGRADIAAAVAADPKLPDQYARWGLKPD
jgi:tetratricopeptide (TPR) repeat protein